MGKNRLDDMGWQTFSVRGPDSKYLGSAGHKICVVDIIDNTVVSIKLCLQKGGSSVWPTSCSLLSLGLENRLDERMQRKNRPQFHQGGACMSG